MNDDRLAHLREVSSLLWPQPLRVSIADEPGGLPGPLHGEYLLLPSRRRPRLLVPRGRRAAVGAIRGYGVGRSRSARWQAAGLAAGMATGLAPLLLRDRVRVTRPAPAADATPIASIDAHLADVLGTEVLVSMYLSAPRANRKPVLQVLSPDGRTLAYAKVGVDPLTCRLVRDETVALTTLAAADLKRTTVPTVMHSGRWHGLELLLQSPLPVADQRRRPTPELVAAAQAEVASIGGHPGGPLSLSRYWARLTDRIEALPTGTSADTLAELTARIAKAFGAVQLRTGAWHGDWTQWNTAGSGDRLLVWDWERFAPSVPVGYDALHCALQTEVVNHLAEPAQAAGRAVATADAVLAPFGLSGDHARATVLAYLTELACRYLEDRQAEAGARLGDVGRWLLPAILRALEAP